MNPSMVPVDWVLGLAGALAITCGVLLFLLFFVQFYLRIRGLVP